MKILIYLCFLLYLSPAHAKGYVVDKGQLMCSYYYTYSKDTVNLSDRGEDLLFLCIGSKISKCYSYYTYQSDSLKSTVDGMAKFGMLIKEAIKREGYMTNAFPHYRMTTCVYKNYPEGKMTVTDFLMSQYYVYNDSLDAQDWVVDGDSIKNVLGYECQKATCQFRGRQWTAWFAVDIPISNGPWKFGGLPGLIMEVYDKGRQQYFCIKGLQKDSSTPIVYDTFDRKRSLIDRKTFLHSQYKYFHNQNSITEAETGISLGISEEQRSYDLIEREK